MKEISDIIAAYENAFECSKKTALATVVHVEGSSYRRPGARMLVTEDGALTGAISGGCLEGDALNKALLAISQQKNKLVTYNTLDEDDHSIGIQLGCNGIVHILFEPINASDENNPIALLKKLALQTEASVIVTLFCLNKTAEQPGTCLLAAVSNYHGYINNQQLRKEIENDIEMVFENQCSVIKRYASSNNELLTGFIELVKPVVEIIIAGAGNDALPLVQMAAVLGWHVTIADGRKTHANRQRFPQVKNIIVGRPPQIVEQINITDQTVFVLMSHNYNYDLTMLRQLAHTNCKYIGMLGPKSKLEKMFKELQEGGIEITDVLKEKIYGPVGLDIGAETAEEIALAVIAEIKAVLSKKDAATLRDKNGFIHQHNAIMRSIA